MISYNILLVSTLCPLVRIKSSACGGYVWMGRMRRHGADFLAMVLCYTREGGKTLRGRKGDEKEGRNLGIYSFL